MLFQTFDDKQECVAVYCNDQLTVGEIPDNPTKTWSYAQYLKGRDIQYASIYAEGASIGDACPQELKSEWEDVTHKMMAFATSFKESKVSLRENCYLDLMPRHFLVRFCDIKNRITKHILETRQKPEEYSFYREMQEFVTDIKYRPLNIDLNEIVAGVADPRTLEFYQKVSNSSNYISYNIFGSVTGRLTTEKDSFPWLTMPARYRKIIKPTNDWIVTIDMNAAEIRTILALLGHEQVDGDLYDWIDTTMFDGQLGRTIIKKVVTSWLYGSNSPEFVQHQQVLEKLFDKQKLRQMYWDGQYVNTPFGRKIAADEYHSISYLGQSTFIDLFHRQVLKVDKFLENKKTKILGLLHDECIIDLADEDKADLKEILSIFGDTRYGKYKTKVKIGTNFGDVRELKKKS